MNPIVTAKSNSDYTGLKFCGECGEVLSEEQGLVCNYCGKPNAVSLPDPFKLAVNPHPRTHQPRRTMNTEEKLIIEAGKTYRTRDGHKAEVYANKGGSYPWIGAEQINGSWLPMSWSENGSENGYIPDVKSDNDLIAPWIDKLEWPEGVAAWHNWVAMDEDGEWFSFVNKPHTREDYWAPYEKRDQIPLSYAPKWTGDWRESLIQRPSTTQPLTD